MKSEYDVIVIGAGPAGSVAASAAARQGLDVLLIEKRQEIGEPVRCAEGLFKAGIDEFIDQDPKWICAEINKAIIYGPDGSSLSFSQPNGDVAGYILDRKIFDRALAKKAANDGAEVQVKTQASGLIIEDNIVRGIKGLSRGEPFEVRSKAIIGADGVESRVGRWAGLLSPIRLKDIETCAEFLVTGIDIDPNRLDFYFSNVLCPGGYLWLFPKGPKEANIGLGILGTRYEGKPAIDYLKRFVESRYPDGRIVQHIVGGVPVCDAGGRISTGGLMLAGDGARLVDPLLGAGIMNAMVSGRMAGETAASAIKSNDVSAKALQRYDKAVFEKLGKAMRRNYRMKEFIGHVSDRQMNMLFSSARRMNVESVPVAELYRTATTSGLPVMKIVRHIL